jgi:hypothetical protein
MLPTTGFSNLGRFIRIAECVMTVARPCKSITTTGRRPGVRILPIHRRDTNGYVRIARSNQCEIPSGHIR